MSSFAGAVGLKIDSATCRIPLPKVKVRITAGIDGSAESSKTIIDSFANVQSVEWARDANFNRATVTLEGKRVGYGSGLTEGTGSSPIQVGEILEVKSDSVTIFRGRVMNISHSWSEPNNETVTLSAVCHRYDLFREVLFGQIGIHADPETGEEKKNGPYVGGLAFFNALPCVFNPKEFTKHTQQPGGAGATALDPNGNGRRNSGNPDLPVIFDCDPYAAENLRRLGLPGEAEKRNILWSAWDMIKYVYFYCLNPPLSVIGDLGATGAVTFLSASDMTLGPHNGLVESYPLNVSIQGESGLTAINKICNAAGFSFWYNPRNKKLEFWKKGEGQSKKKIYFSGKANQHGFVHTRVVSVLPAVTSTGWNVSAGEVVFNHLDVIDSYVSVTERKRYQQIFLLRKGWSDEVHELITDVIKRKDDFGPEADSPDQPVNQESLRYKFKGDYKGLVIMRSETAAGKGVGLRIDSKDMTQEKRGIVAEFGRKWIFDEAGWLKSTRNEDRPPFRFVKSGLEEIGGSTYCIGPRPILARNIQMSGSELARPRVFFGKYRPGQKTQGDDGINPANDKYQAFERDREGSPIKTGNVQYPFSAKQGAVKILKDQGGVMIEGGVLESYMMTWDPKKQEMNVMPPVVLGTIEHDQGALVYSRDDTQSRFPFARRYIDGSRYRNRVVLAQDLRTDFRAPTEADKDGKPASVDPLKFMGDIANPIDESPELETFITSQIDKNAPVRAAGRAEIPSIVHEYKLGDNVTALDGRDIKFTSVIVSMRYDMQNMVTQLTFESEAFFTRRSSTSLASVQRDLQARQGIPVTSMGSVPSTTGSNTTGAGRGAKTRVPTTSGAVTSGPS